MVQRHASAPGKVIVCGEYAVLDGAPAISMAVDRRAVATVEPVDGDTSSVATPGFAPGIRRFRCGAGGAEWLDAGTPVPLVDRACELGIVPTGTAVDIVLDTRAFAEGDSKLGIGSSAAIAVALVAAADVPDTAAVAYRLHEMLQRGRGSGVDVATALHGGLVAYRRPGRTVAAREWPAGLAYVLLWSQVPADTVSRLERLEQAASHPSRAALAAAAEDCDAAWQTGGPDVAFGAIRDYAAALRAFDGAHGLGIFDAGHGELAAAAPDGVVYKPCGAGGGDVGIAIGQDTAELAAFAARAEQYGFWRLPVDPAAAGVTSNETDHA